MSVIFRINHPVTGVNLLNENDLVGRVGTTIEAPSGSSGTIYNDIFYTGTPYYQFINTGGGVGCPSITVSGNALSWSGGLTSGKIVYGVR